MIQDKSNQENNKDDNNEDSINLTIGDDDIKLFADEVSFFGFCYFIMNYQYFFLNLISKLRLIS